MRKKERRENDEEIELSREEIEKVLEELKMGKAAGIDGIANEIWRYGGGEVKGWVWKFYNRIWRGEGWPET